MCENNNERNSQLEINIQHKSSSTADSKGENSNECDNKHGLKIQPKSFSTADNRGENSNECDNQLCLKIQPKSSSTANSKGENSNECDSQLGIHIQPKSSSAANDKGENSSKCDSQLGVRIQPKLLKGFRDELPNDEIVREEMIDRLKGTFRRYGFVPIDTPCLEYADVLLRKSNGETEKQVFRFNDNGGRDVALRFDLTVPFARFTAMHKEEIYFPFKRYHIAKVWRGEKPQGGRYREFTQCDFDTIGSDSAASDAEALLVMADAVSALLAMSDSAKNTKCVIHINHRGLLTRFLKNIGAADKGLDVLRAVDRLNKAGEEKVREDLKEIAGEDAAKKILQYINSGKRNGNSWDGTLKEITMLAGGEGEETKRLREVHEILKESLPLSKNAASSTVYVLDPSITRGLDYYTGIVFETFLEEVPSIGSVCSGGRYDNLAGLYMKEHLSGVGASVGLDRLIAALVTLGGGFRGAYKMDAIVFADEKSSAVKREVLAGSLRREGLIAEAFAEVQSMKKQYMVAEKKGAYWGVFITGEGVSVKRLATRESVSFTTIDDAVRYMKERKEREGGE